MSLAHRFVRNANQATSTANRMNNRNKPLENTYRLLTDPKSGKEVHLIGSTHASQYLANRTKDLMESVKPDLVYVQTNQKWYDLISQIQNVNTQQDMNEYNLHLLKSFNTDIIPLDFRGTLFRFRYYSWLFAFYSIKRFSKDFHPFIPGVEVKYALDYAEQNSHCQTHLAGLELDDTTLQSLFMEKRMDMIPLMYRLARVKSIYTAEKNDIHNVLNTQGGEAFSESLDSYRLSWFIKYFEIISPHQKKIIIDKKDEQIFSELYQNKDHKKIVAVVNHWHMPGVINHWLHSTDQIVHEHINPVGDMDIEAYLEDNIVNRELRKIYSNVTKSEASSHSNYITQYYSEIHEQERNRGVKYYGSHDKSMYDELPYNSEDLGAHSRSGEFDIAKALENKKKQKIPEYPKK